MPSIIVNEQGVTENGCLMFSFCEFTPVITVWTQGPLSPVTLENTLLDLLSGMLQHRGVKVAALEVFDVSHYLALSLKIGIERKMLKAS